MSSLLREVVPLALAAAISPVIFLLQLNTLTGERPIARGAALTAGAAIVLIVVSTIGVLVGDTGFSDQRKRCRRVRSSMYAMCVGSRPLTWFPFLVMGQASEQLMFESTQTDHPPPMTVTPARRSSGPRRARIRGGLPQSSLGRKL